MNRPSKIDIPILLKMYMDYLISQERRTKSTAEEYAGDIILFFRYMKIQYKIVSSNMPYSEILLDDIDEDFVCRITVNHVFNFLSYLKTKRKYSESTKRRKIAAIRSYFKYARDICKYSCIDIEQELRLPGLSENTPIYLGDNESTVLINSVVSRNTIRDKMIIALFLHTGIKLMELCNLDITDIDGEYLKISNNEQVKRCIPLNDELLKYLGMYISWRYRKYIDATLEGKNKHAMFLSEQKKRISPRAVQDIILKAAKNAMLQKQVSPQKLRHSFAVFLYKKGFNIKEIQKILGHENIESTQIYLNIPEITVNDNINN